MPQLLLITLSIQRKRDRLISLIENGNESLGLLQPEADLRRVMFCSTLAALGRERGFLRSGFTDER